MMEVVSPIIVTTPTASAKQCLESLYGLRSNLSDRRQIKSFIKHQALTQQLRSIRSSNRARHPRTLTIASRNSRLLSGKLSTISTASEELGAQIHQCAFTAVTVLPLSRLGGQGESDISTDGGMPLRKTSCHHALECIDTVEAILDTLDPTCNRRDRAACVSSASVSRLFSEVALRLLWKELDSFFPLWGILLPYQDNLSTSQRYVLNQVILTLLTVWRHHNHTDTIAEALREPVSVDDLPDVRSAGQVHTSYIPARGHVITNAVRLQWRRVFPAIPDRDVQPLRAAPTITACDCASFFDDSIYSFSHGR